LADPEATAHRSRGLEELHDVRPVLRCQLETEVLHIVVHHCPCPCIWVIAT
jgi:hypothetical protein